MLTLAEILAVLGEKQTTVLNKADFSQSQLEQVMIGIAPLASATANDLAFLANPHYQNDLKTTQAGAVLVTPTMVQHCPSHTVAIVVNNPYLAYAQLSALFRFQPNQPTIAIHPTAIIHATATLGQGVSVGAYSVIGEGVVIGDDCQIDSHVSIEDFAKLGKNCQIKSHVFIGHHCQIGEGVMLHSHASIGNEGFGFAPKGKPDTQGWQKIHQLGKVIIGNHVRIGSQTCIDRGALGDTIIEDNVIIDNLVQIAHNVQIGAGTAIAGCVGIAGSSKVGKRCVLAGGVGLVGHITIADDVTITGMTMVTKSIIQAGSYSSGTPMMPTNLWKRVAVKFKQLV
ncbi:MULTISPECIES: UDP-3-O-(3-hydroxymyristoyl)glucosamine N-acyltransferase [unclassified Moraxella]|uniref:UDP-3-O-(3-hydroxymyristoyl)glucosamine N-acyltransferase n=1 Tax=unclassified Moraxella TaxID=2685852 RepID=UPI003AF55794